MPSNFTEHYQLSQWEAADQVKREDFNADNAKIDAVLAGLAAQMATRGDCCILTGSYVGTGECGPEHPCTITFPKKPLMVFVHNGGLPAFAVYGSQFLVHIGIVSGSNRNMACTWSDDSVSWCMTGSDAADTRQLNGKGITYYYTALLAA